MEVQTYVPTNLTLKYGRGIDKIEILAGRRCHYCSVKTKLVDSSVIYGRDYGKAYLCPKCGAYVGCHKGTKISKGIVADKSLRLLKNEAHMYFDGLWKRKAVKSGITEFDARRLAYSWLSEQTGIELEFCHIGMMNDEQCRQVINLCEPYCTIKNNF